jgi:uncharacterized FlaG/YvyC family protein
MEIAHLESPKSVGISPQKTDDSERLQANKNTGSVSVEARDEVDIPKKSVRESSSHASNGISRTLDKAIRHFGATELKIRLDETADGPIFTIVDKTTGEELLQIPSEYQLSVERAVEIIRGALFDKRV